MIAAFSLEAISGGNAVFNPEKLDWMNGQYIARLLVEELGAAVLPLFGESAFASHPILADTQRFHRMLELLRPRAKRLTDIVEGAGPLLTRPVRYEPDAVSKHLSSPGVATHLAALRAALEGLAVFDESHIEAAVRRTAAEVGIKAGALIHATRVAVTGRTTSPGLFEVLALIGRDETMARLQQLLTFLEQPQA